MNSEKARNSLKISEKNAPGKAWVGYRRAFRGRKFSFYAMTAQFISTPRPISFHFEKSPFA